MRQIFILIISISTHTLFSQELPKFVQDRVDFCNSNLSNEQTTELRKELNQLENYLVKEGLLTDRSGASYRAVYKRIVKEEGLNFKIDTIFALLDTLEFNVYTSCSYKVLTSDQISQLTSKHQKATERIGAPYHGNLTPKLMANRIVTNLTNEDFELEFFRVSALMSFYRTAIPKSDLELVLPDFSNSHNSEILTIEVYLTSENEIQINDKTYTLQEAKTKILEYLSYDPRNRGIELTASKGASYESYLKLTQMFHAAYDDLRTEDADLPKHIFINNPK